MDIDRSRLNFDARNIALQMALQRAPLMDDGQSSEDVVKEAENFYQFLIKD